MKMNNNICSDNLLQIYKLIPFHAKNLALTSKYCYEVFKNNKQQLCTGNYILSSIQEKIINDMMDHVKSDRKQPLIIQSNISTGKTAAILAFSMKYDGTVVIMVPYMIMNHWYLEVNKMYPNNDNIIVLNNQYNKKLNSQCYKHNPSSINKKIIIVSGLIKTSIQEMTTHSLVIMDEVHRKNAKIYGNPKFIGVSASHVKWSHCHVNIYQEEEILPTLKHHDILCYDLMNINNILKNIQNKESGPYLLLCHNKFKNLINIPYIEYHYLNTINLKENDLLLFYPGPNSTGVNLNTIKCIIFIYPCLHMSDTVIQSIGRVTRVTNPNKIIPIYNIHHNREEILLYHSMVSENEILKFCHHHNLNMIVTVRYKDYIIKIIKSLLVYFEFERLLNLNKLYISALFRIQYKDFYKLNKLISNDLNVDIDIINQIIK